MHLNMKALYLYFEIKYNLHLKKGGHIKNAINVNYNPFKMLEVFFENSIKNENTIENLTTSPGTFLEKQQSENSECGFGDTLTNIISPFKEIIGKFSEIEVGLTKKNLKNKKIIFHCEFSQCRGPKLYNLFRNFDRETNFQNYPDLTYPNIYLLEGGYSLFSKEYPVKIEF